MEDMVLFVAPVVVLVLLIVYQFIKESETSKKLRFYEGSIEDLNKRVYTLEKRIQQQSKEADEQAESISQEEIEQIISNKLTSTLNSVLHSLQSAKDSMDEFKDDIDERVEVVESKIKEISSISGNSGQSTEKRVIALYKNGMMVDDIARELGIGIGQVDLMLKVHNLK